MSQIKIESIKEVLDSYESVLKAELGREPTKEEKKRYLKKHGVNLIEK